jgi:hypothetical protein
MQTRKRLEALTSPENLVGLKQKWAKEDALSEAQEDDYLKQAKVSPEDLEPFMARLMWSD